jgi:hypothetical protein
MSESGELNAEQMILVKTAIATLTDLLAAVQGDVEVKAAKTDDDELDEEEIDDATESDGEDDYDSLASAISDVVESGDVQDALLASAEAVDAALVDDDADALEKAVGAFLDVVEENMGGDIDDQLKSVAELLGDLVDQVADAEEEMPSEDTIEKKEDEVEDEGDEPEDSGTVIIDADEMKSLLDSLNQ